MHLPLQYNKANVRNNVCGCVCCTFEAFRSVATAFADKLPRLLRRLFSKLRKHVPQKKTNTFFLKQQSKQSQILFVKSNYLMLRFTAGRAALQNCKLKVLSLYRFPIAPVRPSLELALTRAQLPLSLPLPLPLLAVAVCVAWSDVLP